MFRFRNPPQLAVDVVALERDAAFEANEENPNSDIDDVTNIAYQDLYVPPGPPTPDFYNDNHIDYVNAWVRIRDWVDYFRNRTVSNGFATQKPYSAPQPLTSMGIPIETGGVTEPTWPVLSSDPRGCDVNYLDVNGQIHGMIFQRFGASRGPGNMHRGHDCIANPGDLVVAPESGTVSNIYSFFAGTDAIALMTNTGLTLVLGEIAHGSPSEFGIEKGSTVNQGDPVARIGLFDVEYQLPFSMLHLEMYSGHVEKGGTQPASRARRLRRRKESRPRYHRIADFIGIPQRKRNPTPPPPAPPTSSQLRNPTDYLLRAQCSLAPLGLGAQSEPEWQLQELGRVVMAGVTAGFPH